MKYITLEVEVDHGRIVAKGSGTLPDRARALLTILPPPHSPAVGAEPPGQRVTAPLIQGDGKRIINPSPDDLDASLWGD